MFGDWLGFIVLFIGLWGIQYILTFFQMRHYNERLVELADAGDVLAGTGRANFGIGSAVILVVDGGRIVRAESMQGITVFARFEPLEDVEGYRVSDLQARLDDPDPPFTGTLRTALENALDSRKTGGPQEESSPVERGETGTVTGQ